VASYVFLGPSKHAGQADAGRRDASRATRCPDGPVEEAYHNCLVLRGQGRFAEAADCLRKAIELCPKYAEAIEALQDVESALALSFDDEPE